MGLRKTTVSLVVFMLVLTAQAWADRTERVSEVVDAEGAERMQIEIDFGIGDLDISGSDMEEAATAEIRYTPRWVDYDIDYYKRGNTGILTIEDKLRRKSWDSDIENEWTIVLSTRYETELELDVGACDANLDLGGIPLTDLALDLGAADAEIDFSEVNPVRMDEFSIDVGASSLDLTGLGNARVDRMELSCGAASCEIDFSGDFEGETELDLEVGMGSADITVPRGIAVRVEGDDGFFSSIDFHRIKLREVDDNVWESANYDDEDDRLIIYVDVGMGSVDIYAED